MLHKCYFNRLWSKIHSWTPQTSNSGKERHPYNWNKPWAGPGSHGGDPPVNGWLGKGGGKKEVGQKDMNKQMHHTGTVITGPKKKKKWRYVTCLGYANNHIFNLHPSNEHAIPCQWLLFTDQFIFFLYFSLFFNIAILPLFHARPCLHGDEVPTACCILQRFPVCWAWLTTCSLACVKNSLHIHTQLCFVEDCTLLLKWKLAVILITYCLLRLVVH